MVVVFFAVLGVIALATMGGTSDMHKRITQSVISQLTGYDAKVETLHRLTFFPLTAIEVEGVELSNPNNPNSPQITLDRGAIAIDFFDLILQRGKLRAFHIKGLKIAPNVISPRALRISSADAIKSTGDTTDKGVLALNGHYGKYPINLKVGLSVSGQTGFEDFKAQKPMPISIEVFKSNNEKSTPLISAKASIEKTFSGKIIASDINLSVNGKTLGASKLVTVSSSGTKQISTDGDVTIGQSVINRDVSLNWAGVRPSIDGRISSKSIKIKDIQDLINGFGVISEVWGAKPAPKTDKSDFSSLKSVDANVKFAIEKLDAGSVIVDKLKGSVKLKDGNLDIPITGVVYDGKLKANTSLYSEKSPAVFSADIGLDNTNYMMQEGLTNTGSNADLDISLKGSGDSVDEIKSSLSGDILAISDTVELQKAIPGSVAAGFIKVAMPKFNNDEDLKVNCAVADLIVDKGVAQTTALFLDGIHIVIEGSGIYNIANDNLNITINPKSKDVSFGDVAPTVKATGSISNPKFKAQWQDSAIKLSGFAIGTAINPAIGGAMLINTGEHGEGKKKCEAYLQKVRAVK